MCCKWQQQNKTKNAVLVTSKTGCFLQGLKSNIWFGVQMMGNKLDLVIILIKMGVNSIVTGAAAALSLCLPEPASVKLEENYRL